MELRGFIDDLKDKIRDFQKDQWINNRTRSAIVEFSVYNAQVNIFSTVTCVAEFIGGGIVPWYRIETLRYVKSESKKMRQLHCFLALKILLLGKKLKA